MQKINLKKKSLDKKGGANQVIETLKFNFFFIFILPRALKLVPLLQRLPVAAAFVAAVWSDFERVGRA